MNDMITQLSIFVNNEPGSLANMAKVLKECNVNLKAFNISESSGFGVFRAIVDNPDEAYDRLMSKNLIIKKTELVAVSAANVLGESDINIEYGYAHEGSDEPIIFLRVDDPESAIKAFKDAKMKVITEKDL